MTEISLSDIGKSYDGKTFAISGVNIEIADGEFVVLVGPSGCGKSTLLRMVAGLETISQGEVRIAGKVVNRVEPADRDIAMVFQNYALYPHMTVRQNLAYGLRNRRTPRAEIERRVTEAANILEIGEYLDRKPRQLSGGQRQRVAMGRAIVREPAAFLFDEPLSNLDAKLRVTMRGEIRLLQRRLGTTSLYVTHDQVEAMTLADRLVVLNKGKVEQIGTPMDVYSQPASTFVAEFIGSPSMNLIPANISSGKIEVAGGMIAADTAHSGPVTLGVRPEDLVPSAEGEGFALDVTYVEELGAQRLVHARLGEARFVVTLPTGYPVADVLHVTAAPAALHFFDAATGTRL